MLSLHKRLNRLAQKGGASVGTNTFEASSVHILPAKGGVDALAIGGDVASH
jgi:hypothetical protein